MSNRNEYPNLVKLAAETKEGKVALAVMALGLIGTVICAVLAKYMNINILLTALPGFAAVGGTQQFAMVANAIRMEIDNEK